jgi:hypothetical protein
MKRFLLILMTLASVAQSCFAGLRQYHDDNCYVSTDKCKLFEVINIRSGWRVLLPSHVHEGWLSSFETDHWLTWSSSAISLAGYSDQMEKCFMLLRIPWVISLDCKGLDITPPPPPSSESDAEWAKADGGWAD